MKKYLENINWGRVGKIALVTLPVIIWDITYYLVTKLYDICTVIDKECEKILDNFMGKEQ